MGFFARVCFLLQCGYPLSYTRLRRGCFAKSTISECEMGFIGAWYGAFRDAKEPISQPEMGSFATRRSRLHIAEKHNLLCHKCLP